MRLDAIVNRTIPPAPWRDGEKIPWNDPAFSERMLHEHLSQEHDAASRRFATIDAHARWIDATLLSSKPARLLDLGCGPGLYTARLARLGHACAGIDFAPAAIRYAEEQARAAALDCVYTCADIRAAAYGGPYDLVMLLFGEFNVFRPEDARDILRRAFAALAPGGTLLLEPSTFEGVRRIGMRPASWYSAVSGLFSPRPHLCLQEAAWDDASATVTERFFVIDSASGAVERYAATTQAYTGAQYAELLQTAGFRQRCFYPSLAELPDADPAFMAISARRPTDG